MPPVSLTVPSLTGGISRQPPTQRNRGQVELEDNVTLALSRGTEGRPGTLHVSGSGSAQELNLDLGANVEAILDHWIHRDGSKKYLVLVNKTLSSDDCVQVLDLTTRLKKTVEFTIDGMDNPRDYILAGASSAPDSIRCLSVADTTFFLNRDVVTALTGSQSPYQHAATNVNATSNGHNKQSAKDFDRPPSASGEYWYAREDSVGFPAGFYVSQNHSGVQPWYRRVHSEGTNYALNKKTMPIKMVYDAGNDKFIVSFITWNERLSGDSDTNPGPSFIGKPLRDIVFHRDRLFVASGEQIVGSQSGDLFNFWVDNFANLVDSDPIDVGLSDSSVNNVEHLVGYNKALSIFTDGSRQFEMRADGPLTPNSVNIVPSTSYRTSRRCRPAAMGNQLYFSAIRGESSQIFEYLYDYTSANNVAGDITAHVDGLIPNAIVKLATSENNDILIGLQSNDRSRLYVYYGYILRPENQKAQSAWCTWSFGEDAEILAIEVFDDLLYLLTIHDGKPYLETLELSRPPNTGSLPFPVRLDRRVSVTGSYNSSFDRTTWTLPYKDNQITVGVLGDAWGSKSGRQVQVTNVTNTSTTVTLKGNWSSHPVWFGRTIVSRIRLSQPYVRDQNNNVVTGILQIRRVKLYHRNAVTYRVEVTPQGRAMNTQLFSAMRVGGPLSILGKPAIEEVGEWTATAMCSSDGSTIDIVNDSPYPFNVVSLEFLGTFTPRRTNPAK